MLIPWLDLTPRLKSWFIPDSHLTKNTLTENHFSSERIAKPTPKLWHTWFNRQQTTLWLAPRISYQRSLSQLSLKKWNSSEANQYCSRIHCNETAWCSPFMMRSKRNWAVHPSVTGTLEWSLSVLSERSWTNWKDATTHSAESDRRGENSHALPICIRRCPAESTAEWVHSE